MTTMIERYDTSHGQVELSLPIIKQYFCPLATDQEAMLFLRLCQYQGLNPFLREAYLIKYDRNRPATMVVGKETFTQRAEAHPQYDGFRAGIVIYRDGRLVEVEGSLKAPDEILIGGWAEVFRKDRHVPTKATVSMDEYSTSQSTWIKMPCTMIRKVALVQGLREAFPSSFVGLYDSAEMKVELPDATQAKAAADTEPLTAWASKPDTMIRKVAEAEALVDTAAPVVEGSVTPTGPSTGTTAPGNGIVDPMTGLPQYKPRKGGPRRTKELPHFCTEHNQYYDLVTSPKTGQQRWSHQYQQGQRTRWCLEPLGAEPAEKPDAPDLVTQEAEDEG